MESGWTECKPIASFTFNGIDCDHTVGEQDGKVSAMAARVWVVVYTPTSDNGRAQSMRSLFTHADSQYHRFNSAVRSFTWTHWIYEAGHGSLSLLVHKTVSYGYFSNAQI